VFRGSRSTEQDRDRKGELLNVFPGENPVFASFHDLFLQLAAINALIAEVSVNRTYKPAWRFKLKSSAR
jgi:hypothetical protein